MHKAEIHGYQLRLFEINYSKINSVVGLQSWTTKNGQKRLFRRYWVNMHDTAESDSSVSSTPPSPYLTMKRTP